MPAFDVPYDNLWVSHLFFSNFSFCTVCRCVTILSIANSQTNQIVIGNGATGLGSNTIVMGNSNVVTTAINGNLLLGTTTDAGYKLNVVGDVYSSNRVLIGTSGLNAGTYKLAVNGSAIFTQAVVKLTGSWPDYVFGPTYELASLSDVETFLTKNKHLPDLPAADEIEKTALISVIFKLRW